MKALCVLWFLLLLLVFVCFVALCLKLFSMLARSLLLEIVGLIKVGLSTKHHALPKDPKLLMKLVGVFINIRLHLDYLTFCPVETLLFMSNFILQVLVVVALINFVEKLKRVPCPVYFQNN